MIPTSDGDSSSAPSLAAVTKLPVKLDAQRRVRVSKEQRQVIWGEFERSGESMPGFARRHGLKYSTLAGWVARCRRLQRPARKSALRLLEAVVSTPGAAGLWAHLPGGAGNDPRISN